MATVSEVLAKKAVESIQDVGTGFVKGAKNAFLSELPGFVTTATFIQEIKKDVDKSEKEQRKATSILGDSNDNLKKIADEMKKANRYEAEKTKFAEEDKNEKALLDRKMLSTMEEIRDALVGKSPELKSRQRQEEQKGGGTLVERVAGGAAGALLGKMLLRRVPGGAVLGGAAGAGAVGGAEGGGLIEGLLGGAAGAAAGGTLANLLKKIGPRLLLGARVAGGFATGPVGVALTIGTILASLSGSSRASTSGLDIPFVGTGYRPGNQPRGGTSGGANQFGEKTSDYVATVSKVSGISIDELRKKSFGEFTKEQQDKILQGMKKQEGGRAGDRNVRNNNPGNITIPSRRDSNGNLVVAESGKKWLEALKPYGGEAAPIGKDDVLIYAKFPSEEQGLNAARDMLLGRLGERYRDKPVYNQFETWLGASPSAPAPTTQPVTPVLPTAQLDANRQQRVNAAAERERTQAEKVNLQEKRKELRAAMEAIDDATVKYTIAQNEAEKRGDKEKAAEFKRIVDDLKDARKQKDIEFKQVSTAYMNADRAAAVASATEQTVAVRTTRSDDQQRRDPAVVAELIRQEKEAEYARRRDPTERRLRLNERLAARKRQQRERGRIRIFGNLLGLTDRNLIARSGGVDETLDFSTPSEMAIAKIEDWDVANIRAPSTSPAGGTNIPGQRTVRQELRTISKSLEQIRNQNTRSIKAQEATASAVGARGYARGMGRTGVLPTQMTYYDRVYTGLIKQTGTATQSLVNNILKDIFFPKGQFGVSRQQADRPGFLGDLVSRRTGLQKKTTDLITDLFGKRAGRAYGGIASRAVSTGLDQLLNSITSQMGGGTFSANQVLANLLGAKKQERKLGREQLLYNLFGVPTGKTTAFYTLDKIFGGRLGLVGKDGKISFDTVAKMAGEYVSQGISGLFGFGKESKPGEQKGTFFDNVISGIFGKKIGGGGSAIPGPAKIEDWDVANIQTDKKLVDNSKQQVATLKDLYEGVEDQSTKKDDKGFFGSVIDSIGDLGNSIFRIFAGIGGGTGGGIFGGGGGGGGGLFGGGSGDFFGNLLSAGGNMLLSYGGYKLAGGLTKNIKDPATRSIANLVLGEGLKYGFKQLVLPSIQSAISGTSFATSLVEASPWLAGQLGITGAPIGATGATMATATNAATIEAAVLAAQGGGAGAAGAGAAAAGAGAAGGGAGAAGAGTFAAGDLAAAAAAGAEGVAIGGGAAASSGFLAGVGESIAAFASNPATWIVLGALLLFSFFDDEDPPNHHAEWGVYVRGNNDVRAGDFIFTGYACPDQIKSIAELYGKIAFNVVKQMEVASGIPYPYDWIMVGADSGDVNTLGTGWSGEDGIIYFATGNGALRHIESGQAYGANSVRRVISTFKQFQANPKATKDMLVEIIAKLFREESKPNVTPEERNQIASTAAAASAVAEANQLTGNVSGLDLGVFKGARGGTTFASEQIIRNPLTQDVTYYGEYEVAGPPKVWSVKEGKYVELPKTMQKRPIEGEYGGIIGEHEVLDYDRTILGYDAEGNPIRSLDQFTQSQDHFAVVSANATALDQILRNPMQQDYISGGYEDGTPAVYGNTRVWSIKEGKYVNVPGDDTTILGYDAQGNPIRSLDQLMPVTNNAASSTGSASAGSGTVTQAYNRNQALADRLSGASGGGGGGVNSTVNATNVVDNSVRTNTTVVNTNTRNSDPVLFGSLFNGDLYSRSSGGG